MKTMYAKIDKIGSTQDYPPYKLCYRLIGVNHKDFITEEFNKQKGCNIYVIDINKDDIKENFRMFFSHACKNIIQKKSLWLEINYNNTQKEGSYFYEAFNPQENIENIEIFSVKIIEGPKISGEPKEKESINIDSEEENFNISAFHVGQGMCSLIYSKNYAFLIDAGAGKPITRRIYKDWLKNPKKSSFVNQLSTRIGEKKLYAIISHNDSDHWRILDFDPGILSSTEQIYIPESVDFLALKSKFTISKVKSLSGSTNINNESPDKQPFIRAHRSIPKKPGVSNSECLVIESHTGPNRDQFCLLPGDYCYSLMSKDKNKEIHLLSHADVDAVIVPHHGDKESAKVSINPKTPKTTKAFFSAGTHLGYKHPSPASLNKHSEKLFQNISNNECSNIIEQPLP